MRSVIRNMTCRMTTGACCVRPQVGRRGRQAARRRGHLLRRLRHAARRPAQHLRHRRSRWLLADQPIAAGLRAVTNIACAAIDWLVPRPQLALIIREPSQSRRPTDPPKNVLIKSRYHHADHLAFRGATVPLAASMEGLDVRVFHNDLREDAFDDRTTARRLTGASNGSLATQTKASRRSVN